MLDLNSIKVKVADMSKLVLKMWRMTHQCFLEHDADLIPDILKDENKLNDLEKEITADLVNLSRVSTGKAEKSKAIAYADIVGDLELIGDYCKDILERVQIKIEEKLLFSDDAVKEYEELYRKTEDALDKITCALDKDRSDLVRDLSKSQGHIDSLVDECRQRHDQRLMAGVCSPMACNMFLNMLDFTAAVYYHTAKIAKSLVKIK
jgi:phosphate:Na+ symporter